jgi:hypothetical protein
LVKDLVMLLNLAVGLGPVKLAQKVLLVRVWLLAALVVL